MEVHVHLNNAFLCEIENRKMTFGTTPHLCTTSVLSYGEPQRNGKIKIFLRRNTFFFFGKMAPGLPRQDHIYKTTDESFRLHNNIDEMRCKLDSTENPRSFEKYLTPP